jgi:4-amino-4-deoxy-L-arabinose transferase-like glycosyltransferase
LFLFISRAGSWHAMIDFLRFQESHPPLFYAMMRVWMGVFGTADNTILLLPVILGVALIPVVYFIGRSLFSSRAGLVAASLVCVSPPLSENAALARPYSLLPLLVLVSSWLLVRSLETGDWKRWGLYSGTSLALLLTHNWSFLVVGGQALAVIASRRFDGAERKGTVRNAVAAFAVIALCYLPWLGTLIYQARNAGNDSLDVDGVSGFVGLFTFGAISLAQSTIIGTSDRSGQILMAVSVVVASVLLIIGLYRLRTSASSAIVAANAELPPSVEANRRRIAKRVFIIVPGFATVAAISLSTHSSLLVSRCLAMLAPLLLLLVAQFVASRSVTWSARPGALLVGAAFLTIAIGNYVAGLMSVMHPRSDARNVAGALITAARPTDLIIVAPVWLASSFNYYYGGSQEQFDFPANGRETAVGFARLWERMADPGAVTSAFDRIDSARRKNRRIWLVTEQRYLRKLSSADAEHAYRPRHFYLMGRLRLLELYGELVKQYGEPDNVLRADGDPARLERFAAFLFSVESH